MREEARMCVTENILNTLLKKTKENQNNVKLLVVICILRCTYIM